MSVLYLILPLALAFAGLAVGAFVWTVRSGQLDDVDTPPRRILFDDEPGPRRDGGEIPPVDAILRDGASIGIREVAVASVAHRRPIAVRSAMS